MKKVLSAVLALGISLSLTACGESMEVPTEPTSPAPVWAQAPQERATEPAQAPAAVSAETMGTVPAETTAPPTEPAVETEPPVQEETQPEQTHSAEKKTSAQEEAPQEEKPADSLTAQLQKKMEEKFIPEETILYAKKGVNIRSQGNVDSAVITQLHQGDEVTRIGRSNDGWSAIIFEEDVRYVSSDYLVEEMPEKPADPNQITEVAMDDVVYTNHGVNMREGPGMDRSILVKIPEYTEVHRIATTNTGWFKVEYKDQVGYVAELYIGPKYVDSEEHPTETVVEETVHTTREVNLRKGPSTERQIIGRVPEGTELTRIATTSNEWSKVIFEGEEGYISSKYIEQGPASAEPQAEG